MTEERRAQPSGDAAVKAAAASVGSASVSAAAPLWIAPLDGLIALKRLRGSAQDLADIVALGGQP